MIIFTFCILPAYAQDASAIMKRYSEAIAKIELLSYNVNRVDTFTNGAVWNNTGYCHFRRLAQNKLLGFAFSGKRSDLPLQSWYDGQNYFNIDHDKKSYVVKSNPGRGILGHPGGQTKKLIYPKVSLPAWTHATKNRYAPNISAMW